jgi:hypothetical protein
MPPSNSSFWHHHGTITRAAYVGGYHADWLIWCSRYLILAAHLHDAPSSRSSSDQPLPYHPPHVFLTYCSLFFPLCFPPFVQLLTASKPPRPARRPSPSVVSSDKRAAPGCTCIVRGRGDHLRAFQLITVKIRLRWVASSWIHTLRQCDMAWCCLAKGPNGPERIWPFLSKVSLQTCGTNSMRHAALSSEKSLNPICCGEMPSLVRRICFRDCRAPRMESGALESIFKESIGGRHEPRDPDSQSIPS